MILFILYYLDFKTQNIRSDNLMLIDGFINKFLYMNSFFISNIIFFLYFQVLFEFVKRCMTIKNRKKTEVYHIDLLVCVTQIFEKVHIRGILAAYERKY